MIKYKAGFKYQLIEDFYFETEIADGIYVGTEYLTLTKGMLKISKGYAWDGISGPTWDTKNTRKPSLVHDALYQLIRMEMLPKSKRIDADKIYRDLCLKNGMWSVRANWQYKALRAAGGPSASPSSVKKILRAP